MFAILFGLSMDCNVFLLSAVQDERVAGHSARAAAARTSALIATAGIMTMVFLGFSITDETEVRMIGIGLAAAVLIDISIVRPLLAPHSSNSSANTPGGPPSGSPLAHNQRQSKRTDPSQLNSDAGMDPVASQASRLRTPDATSRTRLAPGRDPTKPGSTDELGSVSVA
jgi:hypothetical protein